MGVVWRSGNKNVFRWVLFKLCLRSHPAQKSVQMMLHCVVICFVVLLATSCTIADVADSSSSSSADSSVSPDTVLAPSGQASTERLIPSESSPSTPIEDSGKTTSANENHASSGSLPEPGRLSAEVRERLIEAIATDLSQPKESIRLESVTAQTWSNGCLGLATKDELCTMALVEGWQIDVSNGDNLAIYRSNESGTVVRRAN